MASLIEKKKIFTKKIAFLEKEYQVTIKFSKDLPWYNGGNFYIEDRKIIITSKTSFKR